MRKLALCLGVAFLCFCCSSASFASSTENENLNARIKLLQERLKEFQNREYKDAEEKLIVEEEGIDLILDQDESLLPLPLMPISDETAEQIVEELENRADVAVTVLFHDSDYDEKYEANKSFFAMIDPPKVIIEDSLEDKQHFYESLRQKVLTATRSSKLDNEERQQLLASLDQY